MPAVKSATVKVVLLCAVSACLVAVPVFARAKVKTIWPEQLVVARWSWEKYHQSPEFVGATSPDGAYFHAAVRFPVGSRVTRVEYVHNAIGGPCLTRVTLFRKGYDESGPESLASPSLSDVTGVQSVSQPVTEESQLVPRNHHYWVEAYIEGDMGRIQAIKVYYRP